MVFPSLSCSRFCSGILRELSEYDLLRRLQQSSADQYAGEQRTEALEVLGLNPDEQPRQIENRCKTLAMRLHPDRGDDAQAL